MNIEPNQNQAICAEIGQQLRTSLSREQATVPYQLRQLLHQLEEADRLTARFSSAGVSAEAADLSHYFVTTTRLGTRNEPAPRVGEAAKHTKFMARVSVLPLDEIFLGLVIASIALLVEIAVLVLLAN
jgi:hypothetical protein